MADQVKYDIFHGVVHVGDIFEAAPQPPFLKNPGAIEDADGNALDPWLLIRARDTAYKQNLVLIEEYEAQETASPTYAEELKAKPVWAVLTAPAEAGGLDFQQQRLGPPLAELLT